MLLTGFSGPDHCRNRHGQCCKPGKEKFPRRMITVALGQSPGQTLSHGTGKTWDIKLRTTQGTNKRANMVAQEPQRSMPKGKVLSGEVENVVTMGNGSYELVTRTFYLCMYMAGCTPS